MTEEQNDGEKARKFTYANCKREALKLRGYQMHIPASQDNALHERKQQ